MNREQEITQVREEREQNAQRYVFVASNEQWLKNLKKEILQSKNLRVFCSSKVKAIVPTIKGKTIKNALAFMAIDRDADRSREVLSHIKKRLDGQQNLTTANLTRKNLDYPEHPKEGNIFYVQLTPEIGCWYSVSDTND